MRLWFACFQMREIRLMSHMNCIHVVSPFRLTTTRNLQFVSNIACGEIPCIRFGVKLQFDELGLNNTMLWLIVVLRVWEPRHHTTMTEWCPLHFGCSIARGASDMVCNTKFVATLDYSPSQKCKTKN